MSRAALAGSRLGRLGAVVGSHLTLVAGLFAVASWSELAVRVIGPALGQPHWPGYWAAARFALDGRIDVLYAGAAEFGAAARDYGSLPDIFNPNAPTSILPFVPFGLLPEVAARWLWLSVSLVAFGLAWTWLLRALGTTPAVALAATGLVAAFRPFREEIARGQAYMLLLALGITAALLAARSEEGRRKGGAAMAALGSGLAIAATMILKLPYGAVLWAVALAADRRRAAAVAALLFAVAAGGLLVAWGPGPWQDFAAHAAAWRTRPETAVTAFQTINGLLSHLFRFDATWNPQPVADLPWLVTPAWAVAVALLGGCSVLVVLRLRDASTLTARLLPFAVVIPAATLLAPIAEQYHYTLTLFSVTVLSAAMAGARVRARWWGALIVAVLLLGGPWRFNVPDVPGWSALLHYPRVYGGTLVWGLIVLMAFREQQRAPVDATDARKVLDVRPAGGPSAGAAGA